MSIRRVGGRDDPEKFCLTEHWVVLAPDRRGFPYSQDHPVFAGLESGSSPEWALRGFIFVGGRCRGTGVRGQRKADVVRRQLRA